MADKKLFHRLKSGPGAEAVGIIPVDMTLGQLRDVDDSAKRDNFVLTYDATTQKFIMVAQTGGPGGGQTSGGGGSVILEAHSGTFLLPTVAQTTLTTTAVNTLVNHYIPSLTGSDVTGFITNTVSGGRGRLTFPKAGFITLIVEGFITIHSTTIGTSGSVGHLVFEADWYSSTGTKKDGFVSSEAIHDASSLAYRDPFSICAGLIPVMANDYIEFKIGFETNVANKNIRISIPAATDSQRENVDVFFYDRMEVEDWAKKNNATLIPANKLPSTGGGGGLSRSEVDARVRSLTYDWAETGNTDPIPANKLTNAPSSSGGGLTVSQVNAQIDLKTYDWAEVGDTSPIPASKLTNAPSSGGGGGSSTLTGLTDTPADLGKEGQVLISETTTTKWDYLRHLGEPDINELQIVRSQNSGTTETEIILNLKYTEFDLILLKTKINGELESLDIRLLEQGDFTDQDDYTWDKDERKLSVLGDRKLFYVALAKIDTKNKFLDSQTVSVTGYESATLQGENVDNFDFVAAGVTEESSGEFRMIPIDLMKGAGLSGRRFETDTGAIFRVTEVSDNYLVSAIQQDGTQENNLHSMLPFKVAEVNKIVNDWSATETSFVIPENAQEWDTIVIVYGTDAQATSTGVKVKEFLTDDVVNRNDLGFTYNKTSRTISMGSGNKVRYAALVKYATVHGSDYLDVGDQTRELTSLKELYSTNLTTEKSTIINKTSFGDVLDTYVVLVNLGGSTVETRHYLLELAKTSGTEGEFTYTSNTIAYDLGIASTQYIKSIYVSHYRDEGTTIKTFTSPAGLLGQRTNSYQTFSPSQDIILSNNNAYGIVADVIVNSVRKKVWGVVIKGQVGFNLYDPDFVGLSTTTSRTDGRILSGNKNSVSLFYNIRLYNIWAFALNNPHNVNRHSQLRQITSEQSFDTGKTIATIQKRDIVGDTALLYIYENYYTGLRTVNYRNYNRYNHVVIDKTKTSGTEGLVTYTENTIIIRGSNTIGSTTTGTYILYRVYQSLESILLDDYQTFRNNVYNYGSNRPTFGNTVNIPTIYKNFNLMIGMGASTYNNGDRNYPWQTFFGRISSTYAQIGGQPLAPLKTSPGTITFNTDGEATNGYYWGYIAVAKFDEDEIITGITYNQNNIELPDGWENADYFFLNGGLFNGVIDIEMFKQYRSIFFAYRGGFIQISTEGVITGTNLQNYDRFNSNNQNLLVRFKDKKIKKPYDINSRDRQLNLTKEELEEYEMVIFTFLYRPSVAIPTDVLVRDNDFSFGYRNTQGQQVWNSLVYTNTSRQFDSGTLPFTKVTLVNFGTSNYSTPTPTTKRPPLPALPSADSFLGLRDTPGRYPSTKKFVVTKPDQTGIEFDEADTLDINASDIDVVSSGFANNLSSTDDDLQKVANKVDEGSSTPKRVTRLPANHTEGEEYYLTQEYPSQTFDVTPVTFRGTEFEGTDLGTRGWAKYEHVAEGGGGFDDVGAITPHHPDGLIMISDKKIAVKDGTLQNLRTLVLSVTTGGTTTITSRTLTLAQGTAPLIATSKGNVDTYTYNADLPAGNWDGLYFRDASNRVVGTAMVKKGKYTSFNGDLQPSGFNADDADIDDEIKFLVEVLEKLGRTDKTVRFVTDGSHFFTANNPFMDPRIVKVSYGRDAADTNYYRRYVVFARLSYIDDDVNNTPEAIAVGTKTLNLSYFESDTGGIVRYRSAVTQVAGDRIASSGATKSINVRFKDKSWSGHDQINKYIRNLDISVLRSNILDKIKDYAKKANTTAKIPKDDFSTTLTRAQWTALSTANKRANHVYYITS